MTVAQPSQTAAGGSPSGGGSTGNPDPSSPDATGKTSYEDVLRERDEARRERDSLSQSTRVVTGKLQDRDAKIKELENPPPAESGSETPLYEWTEEQFNTKVGSAIKTALDEERTTQASLQKQQQDWSSGLTAWGAKSTSDFPDAFDERGQLKQDSDLTKEAVRILYDPNEGLATVGANGQAIYSRTSSGYDAFTRAKMNLDRKAATATTEQETNDDKRGAAQFSSPGKGSSTAQAGSGGKLSDEDYLKLSFEEKQKYQEDQFLNIR